MIFGRFRLCPVSLQIDKRSGGDIQPINLDCINIKSNENRKSHHGDGLPLLLGLMCGALAYLAASSFRAVTIADMLVSPLTPDATKSMTLKAARGAKTEGRMYFRSKCTLLKSACKLLHSKSIYSWYTQ